VLIGHPEHDLLFIATQVARAAGLKDPKRFVQHQKGAEGNFKWCDLKVAPDATLDSTVKLANGNRWRDAWIFTETNTYQMLARGDAPQSQQFRDWVFKEVLPSIRKTGSYNVNESTTETGQQFAGELAALSDAVSGLLKQNATILGMLRRRQRGDAGQSFGAIFALLREI